VRRRGPNSRPMSERIEQRVDRSGGPDACHPWTGAVGEFDGPVVYESYRNISARRAYWEVLHGEKPPKNRYVTTTCHVARCMNPRHFALKPFNDLAARFWPRVARTESCWNWTGYLSKAGYGFISPTATTNRSAHRVAWELTHNVKLTPDQLLLHSCDNPRCVNPAHLRIGTYADNTHDMIERGRAAWQKGDRSTSAPNRDPDHT
jgi:hypothetical protein